MFDMPLTLSQADDRILGGRVAQLDLVNVRGVGAEGLQPKSQGSSPATNSRTRSRSGWPTDAERHAGRRDRDGARVEALMNHERDQRAHRRGVGLRPIRTEPGYSATSIPCVFIQARTFSGGSGGNLAPWEIMRSRRRSKSSRIGEPGCWRAMTTCTAQAGVTPPTE